MSPHQEAEDGHLVMKQISKSIAENGSDETIYKASKVSELSGVPSFEALQKMRTEYKRRDLRRYLPAEYWALIEFIGPPDPSGDPHLEGVKSAICFMVCNMVSAGLCQETDSLNKAEIAEHTWMRCFDKLSKLEEKSKDDINEESPDA